MIYDVEKTVKQMEKLQNDREYMDLVYDLESFIIDLAYAGEDNNAEKQAFCGKQKLTNTVINERETAMTFSKIRPVLLELGMREQAKGFRLVESLVLEAARCIYLGKTYSMKMLYPIVAEKYGITAHNCERLCRYACSFIEIPDGFAMKYPYLEELTHRTYEKVTVKELVDALAAYLVFKCKFKSKYQI